MGKLLSKIFGNKEIRILMLGLDAAGKTCKLMSYATLCFDEHFITYSVNSLSDISNPLQIKTWTICDHHSHRRLQCRDCKLQECQVFGVGCGRTRQD